MSAPEFASESESVSGNRPETPESLEALSKQELRSRMRQRRSSLTETESAGLSRRIQERILGLSCWAAAARVGLYLAVRREVSADLLLDAAWAAGKELFLPFVHPELPGQLSGLMSLVPCRGRAELQAGPYGIAQPRPCGQRGADGAYVSPALDLLLVPGVAFDRQGNRLGAGGGYYDRFLGKEQGLFSIGLAYSFQVLERLPVSPWDQPVRAVCTEDELISAL